MFKDKEGNKLTRKELFSRWAKGIEGITPLQQVTTQMYSTWIIIIGLLVGIVICIIGIKRLWWLLIILIGGFGNTSVQLLGQWQKRRALKKIEFHFNENLKGG